MRYSRGRQKKARAELHFSTLSHSSTVGFPLQVTSVLSLSVTSLLSPIEVSEDLRNDVIAMPCGICGNVLNVIQQIQAEWLSQVAWMAHDGQNQLKQAIPHASHANADFSAGEFGAS